MIVIARKLRHVLPSPLLKLGLAGREHFGGIKMGGRVESLFAQGDGPLLEMLPQIAMLMDNAAAACALRLVLLAVAEKTDKSEFSFTRLTAEGERLLSIMGAKGDRAAKGRLEKPIELNDHTIRRYVFLENAPRDSNRTGAFLALLAANEFERRGGFDARNRAGRLARSALMAFDFVQPILKYIETKDPTSLYVDRPDLEPRNEAASSGADLINAPEFRELEALLRARDLEGLASKALRALLKVDPDDQKNIGRLLFGESDVQNIVSMRERSYYVLYRYSTQIPEIVKTFLVIDSPSLGGLDCFKFTHVYISKRNRVKRITRGTLLGFSESIYLVGMAAPVLRGRDPQGRQKVDQAQGLKAIVIPTTEAQDGYDLLPGLYMSNSLHWQPIVGRIVLVHVGFESIVGPLTDTHAAVKPDILHSQSALANDLRKLCSIPKSSHTEEYVPELAREVLTRINNRPYCDKELVGDGTIRALQAENKQAPGP